MSPKTIAARRARYLKALRDSGNVTLSAERARVARSWVHNQRKKDPEFDTACRAAAAAAREAFAALGTRKPPAGWGYLDGAELVVKAATGRRIQITRARTDQWTPSAEARFLAVLAATCNVKAACSAVRMSTTSAYHHRRRWPAFARRWHEAIAEGYMRLEAALLEAGCNLFSGDGLPPPVKLPPVSVAEAVQLLHMHKKQVHGLGKAPGRRPRPRSLEELKPRILRKFEAFEAGRALSKATRAADAREHARRRFDPEAGLDN